MPRSRKPTGFKKSPGWVATCSIPGVDFHLYFLGKKKPTFKEIDRVWRSMGGTPLVDDPECKFPLRDAYPGCASVKKIEIYERDT